jgi:hypothetical protein
VVVPKNAFAYKFIGKTLVVYHNQNRKNTSFGKGGAKVISYQLKLMTENGNPYLEMPWEPFQHGMCVNVGWNGSMWFPPSQHFRGTARQEVLKRTVEMSVEVGEW